MPILSEALLRIDRRLLGINSVLERIANRADGDESAIKEIARTVVLPILQQQNEHFLYEVVEHAASEVARDADALDLKISALLAAQAAIAAIFIEKGFTFISVASVFVLLSLASMLSLRLWGYERAPDVQGFVVDFIENPKVGRLGAIRAKLAAARRSEQLLQRRGGWFTGGSERNRHGVACVPIFGTDIMDTKMDIDKLLREQFARDYRPLAEYLHSLGVPSEPLPENGRPPGYYIYYVQNGIRSYPNRRR